VRKRTNGLFAAASRPLLRTSMSCANRNADKKVKLGEHLPAVVGHNVSVTRRAVTV